ncbi:MAG: ribosomal-processing cysteine protease Prp [Aerococcus sp.]|nr:ribosomal-processing cysteine protease Prp [Aerococcus sp.]
MIIADFKKHGDDWLSLDVTGHALAGEYGHDIVCSAVSVLAIGLANNLERMMTEAKPLIDSASDGGYLHIERPESLSQSDQQTWQWLFESTYSIMVYDLEPAYGEYVEVHCHQQ